jgi:hypothetical protein
VDSVSVAKACGVERFAVVVDGHGTEDELVFAVGVHVGHRQVVVPLPGIL